jgi:GT2 family glycosyltransferase
MGDLADTPEVSVIIPLRNGADTLAEQLAALSQQDYVDRWELIIADNGSTDAGPDLVSRWTHPTATARVVDASELAGVSYARNAGARAALGRVLVFCDADDIVHPQWLGAMVQGAGQFDLVGGALEVSRLNPPEVEVARPNPQGTALPIGARHLRYAIGANFAVRRRAFDDLGGWNPQFVGGCDDVDFCWRAQYLGYTIGFAQSAVISYRYRTGMQALWRQHYRYGLMEPLLYREHRRAGMPRRTWKQVLVAWRWFLRPSRPGSSGGGRTVGHLWSSRAARLTWTSELALQMGRIRGSLRYRCLYL